MCLCQVVWMRPTNDILQLTRIIIRASLAMQSKEAYSEPPCKGQEAFKNAKEALTM